LTCRDLIRCHSSVVTLEWI